MKILKTIVAALLLSVPVSSYNSVSAQTEFAETDAAQPTHFVLCLNDGEQIAFVLEHNPKVMHGNGYITVVDNETTIEYPLDNLHKYILDTPTSTGIDAAKGVSGEIKNIAGDIILTGFDAAMPVNVFDVNGMEIFVAETSADGSLTIRMSQYPAGVYIIKANNKTFKFIKR